MILAGVRDYMFPWQLPFFGLYVLVWLIGGTYLVRWALARMTDLPKRSRGTGQAFLFNFLTTGSGLVAMLFLLAAFGRMATYTEGGKLAVFAAGAAVAFVAMFAMAWAVSLVLIKLPGQQLLKIVGLSNGILMLGAGLLGVALFVPSRMQRIRNLHMERCVANLQALDQALTEFSRLGPEAESLEQLVASGAATRAMIVCPGRPDVFPGYLYQPAERVREGLSEKIRVCDRRGNHGGERLVLFADGRIIALEEDEFAEKLDLPENAAIAEQTQAPAPEAAPSP
jgi:hypothetical protein